MCEPRVDGNVFPPPPPPPRRSVTSLYVISCHSGKSTVKGGTLCTVSYRQYVRLGTTSTVLSIHAAFTYTIPYSLLRGSFQKAIYKYKCMHKRKCKCLASRHGHFAPYGMKNTNGFITKKARIKCFATTA